jgi:hypothetical protein
MLRNTIENLRNMFRTYQELDKKNKNPTTLTLPPKKNKMGPKLGAC